MTPSDYLWRTRVTVANILNHARLIAEGWSCRHAVAIKARKERALRRARQ